MAQAERDRSDSWGRLSRPRRPARLSLWHRLAIAATLLWLAGGSWWIVAEERRTAERTIDASHHFCELMNRDRPIVQRRDCSADWSEQRRLLSEQNGLYWESGIAAAGALAAIAWVLASVIIFTVTALLAARGRRAKPPR